MSTATAQQLVALSKRSVQSILRQPSVVVPSMVFPLFFVALGTSSFGRAISIPGFPVVDSFLDFALAGSVVQGVLFGSITSATALATDIETGFFDRLLLTPSPRVGILVGRLAGAMVYGFAQTVFFVVVLLPFGLSIKSGVLGLIAMMVGGLLTALAVGAVMSAMALRTGSSEAVQGSFPLLFVLLFFSSAFFPRQTMDGIYRRIADLNPVSYLVEGFRSLTIGDLSTVAVAQTIAIPAAIAVGGLGISMRSLRRRVAAS
ncbi:MAG: ABC transporter permease [Actinomycetota bacterium]|jgi:ABC-2 type transport system permease protein|nr:ABC transporter permease [Actinomycetota bacterium]MDA3014443.1 ABC transporter permease [Actinomycetota bacterium]MDA3027799.1 ABC transporter permease [Actinomycetota bacterium]